MRGRLKRRTIIVLCVLGAVILALTVALSVVCHSRALYEGEVADDGAYASVMADIEDMSKANPRVVDLAMLGSHNANTCNLDKSAGISGEAGKGMGALNTLAPGLSYRYTKNQVSDIYSQLRQGVRFLCFRCSYYEGEWCGSHTLIDAPMRVYVQDVIRFLRENPGEIVVLFFNLRDCAGVGFSETIDRLFSYEYDGQTLQDYIPYENIPLGELRYNDVTKEGTKGGAAVLFSLYHAKRSGDLEAAKSNAHFGKIFAEGGVCLMMCLMRGDLVASGTTARRPLPWPKR